MLAFWMEAIALLQFCSLNGVSGDLTVTLAVFSGVPDPEWTIASSHPDYMEIKTRLSAAIQNGWAYLPENIPAILGYKGFLVIPNMEEKKSVVGEPEKRLIVGPTTVQLQTMLFNTMPKDALPDDLRKEILKVIASGVVKPQEAPKRSKRYAPTYSTAPWSLRSHQPYNNCYNYATTIVTDTFAQPGRRSGNKQYPPIQAYKVRIGAESDGLATLNVAAGGPVPTNPALPNQNHVVALVVWRYRDFHWYRLDADGTWSHKPGQTPVTQLDNAGNPINDPRNAAMAGYQFVTFMTCNRNTINII
ncbi:hypothetical protein ACROYT_G032473 [Oculina patagonica]